MLELLPSLNRSKIYIIKCEADGCFVIELRLYKLILVGEGEDILLWENNKFGEKIEFFWKSEQLMTNIEQLRNKFNF